LVDADSGLVHSVIGTAANVNDVTQGHALLHGQEQVAKSHALGCTDLDGQEGTYAEGRGMSASASRQRAAIRLKHLCKPAKNEAVGADVSHVDTYSSTTDSQTEF
jgi:IS5 family transposase